MTTPLVDPSDLGLYLGRDDLDDDRAALILGFAQGLCELVVNPLPAAAAALVMSVAARAYTNTSQVQSMGLGPASIAFGSGAQTGGLYLTREEKAQLSRLGGRGGAFSIDPTPTDAGTSLDLWNRNATWLSGVPMIDEIEGGR